MHRFNLKLTCLSKAAHCRRQSRGAGASTQCASGLVALVAPNSAQSALQRVNAACLRGRVCLLTLPTSCSYGKPTTCIAMRVLAADTCICLHELRWLWLSQLACTCCQARNQWQCEYISPNSRRADLSTQSRDALCHSELHRQVWHA